MEASVIKLQEHQLLTTAVEDKEKYSHLKLVSWDKPRDNMQWGCYASYKIGAEWVDENYQEAIVVTPKSGMENLDFMGMFMTCFSSGLDVDRFSEIYTIDWNKEPIKAPALKSIVSPLIVLHFLGVVSRIKRLKKGYVHHNENLKKVKGHIDILKNERKNIALKRCDRIYCKYDEYSEDIAENRLLKKALLFSQRLMQSMGNRHQAYGKMRLMMAKSLSMFEGVSDEVQLSEVRQIKTHKLFKEYAEAIRLAKLILRHFDYSINNVVETNEAVIPFTLDMSLLYEHYVYGLLHEAYGNRIKYQSKGKSGYPDFLYASEGYKAILDTKYIPRLKSASIDTYIIRQLCGYSRDLELLREMGYEVDEHTESMEIPPCVIIYPIEDGKIAVGENPFMGKSLESQCIKENGFLRFYKVQVPMPMIK